MVADEPHEPLTLSDLLMAAARRAPEGQLLAMALVGLGGAATLAVVFGRVGWLGAAAALTVGAYGGWGMADRELSALYAVPGSRRTTVNLLRLGRAVAAIVATLAAVSALGAVFVPMLGLWRS